MEEDKVEDEFASFKRRLESRTGKDDERNDAVQEGEAKSDTPEASDCSSGSEGDGEVCISWLVLAVWLRLSPFICLQFSHYQRDSLASHNKYRAKHGAPALVLDRKVRQ